MSSELTCQQLGPSWTQSHRQFLEVVPYDRASITIFRLEETIRRDHSRRHDVLLVVFQVYKPTILVDLCGQQCFCAIGAIDGNVLMLGGQRDLGGIFYLSRSHLSHPPSGTLR